MATDPPQPGAPSSPGPGPEAAQPTVHEALGGDEFFVTLVERMYDGVAGDPAIRPLYPEDLTESRRLLAGFLIQYWGGSTAYSEERGHPRLRMRHPFVIGPAQRDAWLRHMSAALHTLVGERGIPRDLEARLLDYFAMAAEAMRNSD